MNSRSIPFLPALVLTALASTAQAGGNHAAGVGQPGVAANATRTVQVDMSDAMRFTPSSIDVQQGETIRLRVTNSGRLPHELVIGSAQDLKAHEALMKQHPDMVHADENMVSVAPGQTGELVWQFTQAGRIAFACLQPGHFDAGMKGAFRVAGKPSKSAKDDHANHQH
jgi:uncharacterized cupredoxin-like copper-binding protein